MSRRWQTIGAFVWAEDTSQMGVVARPWVVGARRAPCRKAVRRVATAVVASFTPSAQICFLTGLLEVLCDTVPVCNEARSPGSPGAPRSSSSGWACLHGSPIFLKTRLASFSRNFYSRALNSEY